MAAIVTSSSTHWGRGVAADDSVDAPDLRLFVFALFVLATGVVLVQIVGNPLISLLGPPRTASSRLTFAPAFNSVGTTSSRSSGRSCSWRRSRAARRSRPSSTSSASWTRHVRAVLRPSPPPPLPPFASPNRK